jgi:nitrite reductase/ring-hydroxylating ferredoxin subunit
MAIGVLLLMLAASVIFPAARSISSIDDMVAGGSAAIPVARLEDLAENDSFTFHFRGKPYIIIQSRGTVTVLDGTCPNCGSPVAWDRDADLARCAAGNCSFDYRGHILHGLSADPLTRMDILVSDGNVYLTGAGQ